MECWVAREAIAFGATFLLAVPAEVRIPVLLSVTTFDIKKNKTCNKTKQSRIEFKGNCLSAITGSEHLMTMSELPTFTVSLYGVHYFTSPSSPYTTDLLVFFSFSSDGNLAMPLI